MRISILLILVFCQCTNKLVIAQNQMRTDIIRLHTSINSYLQSKDTVYDKNLESQFLTLHIKLDERGIMEMMEVYGRPEDVFFQTLKRFSNDSLGKLSLNIKNKTIVVPVFYFSHNSANEIDQIFEEHYKKIPHLDLFKDYKNILYVRYLFFEAVKPGGNVAN